MINLYDFGKITCFVFLKFDNVTLPYLSNLVSYLLGSGFGWFKLGWRNESIGVLLVKIAFGVLRNLVIESVLGLYWIFYIIPCLDWNSK